MCQKLRVRPLREALTSLNIDFTLEDSLEVVRQRLRRYIHVRRQSELSVHADASHTLSNISDVWPQLVPQSVKDDLLQQFKSSTSSATLSSVTCAACTVSVLRSQSECVDVRSINVDLLERPDVRRNKDGCIVDSAWYDSQTALDVNAVLTNRPNVLLDSGGVQIRGEDDTWLLLCPNCCSSLKCNRVPPLSLANHLYLGSVPSVLQDLSIVEEAMIAQCRAKCWIVQLKEENSSVHSSTSQRGLRGNIIIYPQKITGICKVLPPSLEDLAALMCVVFVGSQPPSQDWLQSNAKPLLVRVHRVRAALQWLKAHNPLYKDIIINTAVLDSLPQEGILP
ncbi:hypothetical protein C8R42DRAFT_764834, partial [Lentinula raphanica]